MDFWATYPEPILTAFEIKDVNRCPHAYTGKKFSNVYADNFTGSKTAKIGYFRGGVCDKATAQTAQFRAMGIVSGPSRHPKHGLFVSEF